MLKESSSSRTILHLLEEWLQEKVNSENVVRDWIQIEVNVLKMIRPIRASYKCVCATQLVPLLAFAPYENWYSKP